MSMLTKCSQVVFRNHADPRCARSRQRLMGWASVDLLCLMYACAGAGLFLGGMEGASDRDQLKQRGITHVVNAANYDAFPKSYHPGAFQYLILGCADVPTQDLSQFFHKTNTYISEALRQGGAVYVHCYAGVSRAPTLVMAYLMFHTRLSLREAMSVCLRARPQVRPNYGFMQQLEAYGEAVASGGGEQQDTKTRGPYAPGVGSTASPSYGGVANHYFAPVNSVTASSFNDPLRHKVQQPSYLASTHASNYTGTSLVGSVPTNVSSSFVETPLASSTQVPMSSLTRGHGATSQELAAFGSPPGTHS